MRAEEWQEVIRQSFFDQIKESASYRLLARGGSRFEEPSPIRELNLSNKSLRH